MAALYALPKPCGVDSWDAFFGGKFKLLRIGFSTTANHDRRFQRQHFVIRSSYATLAVTDIAATRVDRTKKCDSFCDMQKLDASEAGNVDDQAIET